jgi:hypothetical protein
MKYVRTAGFLIDLRRLPADHRKLFVLAVHSLLRPSLDAGGSASETTRSTTHELITRRPIARQPASSTSI